MNTNPAKNRKLTDEQAVAIRVAYARGWRSLNQLSRQYGLTPCGIKNVVEGSVYKSAGGPITWPGQRVSRHWKVRGWCREELCDRPIAESGWAMRMHLCERCFEMSGGKKCGRYRTGRVRNFTCRICHTGFQYYVKAGGYWPKCCSQACGAVLGAKARVIRPDDLTADRLHELYWGQNLTMREIAKRYDDRFTWSTLRFWLIDAGIPRRIPNWRTYTHCIVEGCDQPRHAKRSPLKNRKPYGRLCKDHLRERDMRRRHFFEAQRTEAIGAHLLRDIAQFVAGLPDVIRTDVEQEVVLAALTGVIKLPVTKESVQPYIVHAFRENADVWRFVSLAAPTHADEGAQTWGQRLGIT